MTAGAVDGRTQRRERNRAAVVDALLSLYREGVLAPNGDQIAARARVSPRSLFRYFEDLDDLVEVAVASQRERLGPLMGVEVDPSLPLGERIDRFVAARLDLYDAMGHVARVARAAALRHPRVAGELARIRADLRAQTARAFAPELTSRRAVSPAEALAAADVACSWEVVDLLRRDQGLGRAASAAVVGQTLAAVLR